MRHQEVPLVLKLFVAFHKTLAPACLHMNVVKQFVLFLLCHDSTFQFMEKIHRSLLGLQRGLNVYNLQHEPRGQESGRLNIKPLLDFRTHVQSCGNNRRRERRPEDVFNFLFLTEREWNDGTVFSASTVTGPGRVFVLCPSDVADTIQ